MEINSSFSHKELENLTEALVSIGFSETEATDQVDQLGQVIATEVMSELMKADSKIKQLSNNEQALQEYLMSPEVADTLSRISLQVSDKLFDDYVQTVTNDLPENEKNNFYNILNKKQRE